MFRIDKAIYDADAAICKNIDRFDSSERGLLTAMFKRKNKVFITLSPTEKRLMITAMLSFRNKLIAANLPTEDVNAILLRIIK